MSYQRFGTPLILLLAIASIIACGLLPRMIEVQGVSMEPSFPEGTRMIIEEVSPSDIERGDLVYFELPMDPSRHFIKRLIGMPGETVTVADGTIYVNGELLDETYPVTPPDYSGSWTLDAYHYFVLGDNRSASVDSAIIGPLPGSAILGIGVPVR